MSQFSFLGLFKLHYKAKGKYIHISISAVYFESFVVCIQSVESHDDMTSFI